MFDIISMNYYIKSRNYIMSLMKAVVSRKGQVTIPKVIRDKLGLHSGTVLEFDTRDGKLIAVKSSRSGDPVLSITGILGTKMDVDAYIDEIRGPAE